MSVTITAWRPPSITYRPPNNAIAVTCTMRGVPGNSSCRTRAPANMAPALSISIPVPTVNPEKASRDLRSYRFSRNSGTVEMRVCR